MSSYTVELRQLIQNGYDIGLKDYPILMKVTVKRLTIKL